MSEAKVTTTAENPIVTTVAGQIEGKAKHGVSHFFGIPYAAPPVSANRFKAPQPVLPWQGVRPARRASLPAPQRPTGGMTASRAVTYSEDCLYLNVTTPDPTGERPVMVWIHGGNFRTGQGAIPWYDGTSFANQGDIVIVSINYRMGVLGFADLSRFGEEYANSGANGILDQLAALQWVKDNISVFGGNPNNVCVAGESAGAFSVSSLLVSPKSKGLFKRAIAQSGAAHNTLPKVDAEKVTDRLLNVLALDDIGSIQNLEIETLLNAQDEIDRCFDRRTGRERLSVNVSPFYPAEGNEVIPIASIEAAKAGMGQDIDLLLGSNKDEATLFGMPPANKEKLMAIAKSYGGEQSLIDAYQARYPQHSDTELALQISTDHSFRVPALRLAETRMKTSNTWLYFFAWESRVAGLKSTHALEIPFVFNNLTKLGVDVFIGPGELPQSLADEMHRVWIDFIQGADLKWPRYSATSKVTMAFDTTSQAVSSFDGNLLDIWQGLR